jgi:hypothetical protein
MSFDDWIKLQLFYKYSIYISPISEVLPHLIERKKERLNQLSAICVFNELDVVRTNH